jgi:coenzyme F420-reducing hydrogenase alpha subunit
VEKILSSHQNKNLVPDFVVSNDLSEIKGDLHKFKILNRSLEVAKEGESLSGLAQAILELAG